MDKDIEIELGPLASFLVAVPILGLVGFMFLALAAFLLAPLALIVLIFRALL